MMPPSLDPVLPPALTDAVMAPLIVGEALLAALISSSQSMIIPGVALLLSLIVPAGRNRWRRLFQPISLPGEGSDD